MLSPIGVTAAMDLGSSFPCPSRRPSAAVSLFLSAQLPLLSRSQKKIRQKMSGEQKKKADAKDTRE